MDLGRDCGYGSYFLGKILAHYGISSAFVMPQYLNKCHLFVAKSLLTGSSKFEENEEDELEENQKSMMNETLNQIEEDYSEVGSEPASQPIASANEIESQIAA